MSRISTAGSYNTALLNIMSAQTRQSTAQQQVSGERRATSLAGYGASADALVATRTLKSRVDGYLANSQLVASTLTIQDEALGRLADTADGARTVLSSAISNGSGSDIMGAMQSLLDQAVDGLNTEYLGKRLFAGAQGLTSPVGQLKLADIASASSIDDLFSNDQTASTSRLDDNLTLQTGFLASDLGTPMFQAFKAIQTLNTGALGPLSGTLTADQETAVRGIMADFETARSGLSESVARNGGVQSRVDSIRSNLADRQTAFTGILGDMTEVDMAGAISRLQLAQTSLQASAQVFSTLNSSSLLNVLR